MIKITAIMTTVLMGISISAHAQKVSDIKRLNKQESRLSKQVSITEKFINEDRVALFKCHSDLEAPFNTLKDKTLNQMALIQESLEQGFESIIKGAGGDLEGLDSIVEAISARKLQIKNEKNKIRRQQLKLLLEDKIVEVRKIVQSLKAELGPNLQSAIQKMINLDGFISVKTEADSIAVKNLLNSCETKDCVYLISAEIKNIVKQTASLNKSIKIVSGISIGKSKIDSKTKTFKKLDRIVTLVSQDKPLADIDISCVNGVTGDESEI